MTRVGFRGRALIALAAGAAALAAALVLIFAGGGGAAAPSDRAARLLPADTQLYVNLSTDRDRAATAQALALARRFPDLPAVERAILAQLSPAGGGQVSFRRDIRPWLGEEAALAVLPGGRALIVAAVRDEAGARAFLDRTAGAPRTTRHRGVALARYGAVAAAFPDGELVLGEPADVRTAIDLAQGSGRALADAPTYRRATAGEPGDRFARIYASAAGLRGLVRAQGGVLGALGGLLDQRGLKATALSLSAREDGLAIHVHSLRAGGAPAAFAPELVDRAPEDTLAFLAADGLGSAVGRVLGLAGAVGGGSLGAAAGELAPLLRGESAILLLPALPAPSLTLIAPVHDEAATRAHLADLEPRIAKLFKGGARWKDAQAGGVALRRLDVPSGELDYAVAKGLLLVSTSGGAIAHVLAGGPSLGASAAYHRALLPHPDRLTSVLFLDFRQLLGLAEMTGLARSAAFQAVRADLERVRAVGATTSGGEGDTTAELFLEIS